MTERLSVTLRPVEHSDLCTIFEYQQDPEANAMAVANPRSEESFFPHWKESLHQPGVVARVMLVDGAVVGHISKFSKEGRDTVGYWVERSHWGRGVASAALGMFLEEVTDRPLYATAARSNAASVRVLTKCGFELTGYEWVEETERFPAREEAKFVLS